MIDKQNEIVSRETTAPMHQADSMMQMIREVIASPDANQKVDVLRSMLDLQRDLMKDQAERELDEALANLNFPVVKKSGKIPLPGGEVSFAKWPDIYRAITPILRERGLGLSFTAPKRSIDGGGSDMRGRVFRNGAFREAEISLPLDTGPGRNNLQSMGSTISYGKKYLTFMLLNIATEDEDDDGQGSASISIEQAAEIDMLLRDTKADVARFLKWIGAPDVQSIQAKNYGKAIAELKKKAKTKGAAA